ncbi:uncharacterized protein LOC128546077 [Mercenaria mercenaria]|uniref:uncharacterized protein LOC128546077 n=1 Tax=Mercenaria mercenaria TaxID=6596 RepID=UPI00234FAE2E|nr:uncharacterized protein LOC128546077 [Mercenaria mercenaria]
MTNGRHSRGQWRKQQNSPKKKVRIQKRNIFPMQELLYESKTDERAAFQESLEKTGQLKRENKITETERRDESGASGEEKGTVETIGNLKIISSNDSDSTEENFDDVKLPGSDNQEDFEIQLGETELQKHKHQSSKTVNEKAITSSKSAVKEVNRRDESGASEEKNKHVEKIGNLQTISFKDSDSSIENIDDVEPQSDNQEDSVRQHA